MTHFSNELGFRHRFVPAQREGAPVLLLLHGTGGDESDLLPLGAALCPGAARLSPRGQVLENGMPRFFRRLAEGVFDVDDLEKRTHELADFVAAASSRYGFDAAHVVAVGYSNGANIAASTLLLRPQVLAGAVLLRPMVPLVPEAMPDLSGRAVFIGAGRRDPIVPSENTQRLAGLLRESGADVALSWQDGGHGITPEDVAGAQEWLASGMGSRDAL